MRSFLVISALALLFSSCSSVEDFRAPIENLTSTWEGTTATVTEFVNTLQPTQQDLQNQFSKMSVPEELTLNEASAKQVAELKEGYQEELSSLNDLSENVSSFVSDWQVKAEKLTELKEGLAAGNLGATTMETVKSLQADVENATSVMESWKGELEDIKENTGDIFEQFNALIANLQGS